MKGDDLPLFRIGLTEPRLDVVKWFQRICAALIVVFLALAVSYVWAGDYL